jgi:polysaccharide export outer membrane protein
MPELSIAVRVPAGDAMCDALKPSLHSRLLTRGCTTLLLAAGWLLHLPGPLTAVAQTGDAFEETRQSVAGGHGETSGASGTSSALKTSEDWNRRLGQLVNADSITVDPDPAKYRIGPDDVLDISVFAAPELNRIVRVSSGGDISLPLLGSVRAAGLTPVGLESHLQDLLRRSYMKDPHVSVFVRDLQSHPVSVMGAVKTPGVFQVRGPKTLLEVLSLAGGLSDDAGDTAIIMRGATSVPRSDREPSTVPGDIPSPPPTAASVSSGKAHLDADAHSRDLGMQVNLKDLLDSADPHYNAVVYPGDIVKVTRAGVVYVVGEVKKPGGFTLKSSEKLSVLQAIALSEGLTPTAAKSNARVIRTDPVTGERKEFGIDLNKIMKGKDQDIVLESKDIVFVPNSATRTTFSRGAEAAAQTLTGLLIFHW